MTDLLTPITPDVASSHAGVPETPPRLRFLEPSSLVPTYVGIGVIVAGFICIAVGWGQVAGETSVARQLPYLASAGFTGLALVMVGLVVVNVAAKRQDAARRARQIERLADILADVKRTLDAQDQRS